MFKSGPMSGAAGTYKITPNGEIETTVFIVPFSFGATGPRAP